MEIKSYRDLQGWQSGRSLVGNTYTITQSFPKSELEYQKTSSEIALLQKQLHSLRQKLKARKQQPSSQSPIP